MRHKLFAYKSQMKKRGNMNIKKIVMMGFSVVTTSVFAADPGGTPGLVKAIFKGSACDTTSDVVANAIGYTVCPDEMYAGSLGEKTTVAWAGYMHMTGSVQYNFKGCYDDYVTVKIGGSWIVTKGSDCQERTGSYTPPTTDWYKIEFRVANNGGGGGCQNASQYGILWNTSTDGTWCRVMDYGDGSVFKTGVSGLKKLPLAHTIPLVVSSKMRATDPTVMDVRYRVVSDKPTVNVRALAFENGERSFQYVVRPETFIEGTDANIGDGIAANVEHRLSWKVDKDWKTDLAKVKFEILTSDMAQLPLKTMVIPATAKNPAMTVATGTYTDTDIFNALLWHYASGVDDLVNVNGYVDATYGYANQVDTTPHRFVNRTTLNNRMEPLRYVLNKMGWEPLEGGNLLNYVRAATRKELWYNSGTQSAAILKSTKPASLYIGEKAYCVIDVSGGPSATSYPVSYLDTEPVGGWGDEYKTTKILLRRVEAGKFLMQNNKEVTLTKPYYMGVFTVTQKQYEQVMGTNPTQTDHRGPMRPVEISWNAIRGDSAAYNWPTVKTVNPATFVGKIQAKTGLNFDLPTDAQWEYVCRAGTSSDYGNGGGGDNDLRLMGHSWSVNAVAVGLYLPNFWGFYDMHGNVGQWCLDYSDGYNSDSAVDYVGAESGSARVIRGYRHGNYVYCATSFYRDGDAPSSYRYLYQNYYVTYLGFRLSRTLAE